MSRSKRFRVLYVTGSGSRGLARRGVRFVSATSHKLRVVVEPEKTSAACLNCDFKIVSSHKCELVIFDAESHGQIVELDCSKQDQESLLLFIKDIRSGLVNRKSI